MTETETPETGHVDIPADLEALTVAQLREIHDAIRDDDVVPAVPKSAPKAALVEAIEDYRTRVQTAIAERLDVDPPEEIEGEAVEEADEEIESTALALREEPVVAAPALLPSEAEFDAMLTIAARIASTQMVPTAYRGKPDDVLAAILTGREMGLGPMQSLRDIYVVDGKPSLSANLLLARLREGGVVILESECNDERAWIRARRRDTGEVAEVDWTYEDAAKITYRKKGGATGKLVEKDNWLNYRPDMLWARAVGRLARRLGPDLIGAAMPYTSEEVQDWDPAPAPGAADSGERGFGSDRQTGTWISPKDWRSLSLRISSEIVLGDDAGAWMEELAEKAYKRPSLAAVVGADDLSADVKRDLWARLLVVLRRLEDEGAPNGVAFLPDPRRTIQTAIAAAFDNALALDGPAWALSSAEAEAGRPSRDGKPSEAVGAAEKAETEAATETSTETPEAASEPEDAPAAAPEPTGGDDLDAIAF